MLKLKGKKLFKILCNFFFVGVGGSEENYVPQPKIELASMLTALYCVKMIQAEIHQLFQGRACTNTILVKL